MRIAYNPLYKPDGKTKVGALTSAPINDIVFDLPGKSIWAKGLKFLGTDSLKIIIGSSSDTVAGTWTGQHSEIGRYEDGLTIIYIPKVAGASTTTLNINGLGAKTCYYSGNSKLITHYPAGTPILFTYYNDGWRRADYNSNTTNYRPIKINDTLLGNNNYILNFKSDSNISYVTTTASNQTNLTIGINIQTLKNNLGVSTTINSTSTNDQLPTSKSVYDFVGAYLTSYMHWKGNTPSSGTTFTIPNAASIGDAYRIAVAGTLPAANSITGSAQVVEVGDIIICTDATGPKYTVAQTNWTTIAGTSALVWNSEVTLATIGGLAIKAKLPINPTTLLKSISFTKADGTIISYNGSTAVDLTGGINYATLANQVKNNLIIKWGNTEGTNLFTYNGSIVKTIDLSIPFSQLFTSFGNVDTGFKATNIIATVSGVTKSFAVNWAIYAGRSQTADKWTTARTLTIGNAGKSVDGSANVSWSLAEIGVSAAAHTHSVKINGATKTIAASNGAAVDLGSYLPLSGGTMALGEGLKFHANENYFGTNLDARIISLLDGNGTTCDGGLIIDERCTSNGTEYVIELLRIRDTEFKWKGQNILHVGNSSVSGGGSTWGSSITVKINGTSKTLTIPNNPNTDERVRQVPKTDNINRPLMMINGNTSTGEQINTSMFSTGIYANASTKMITANGFIKAGSSDNYVLLGGGNHKALSDFSMTHSHPYLPLAGGTMAGNINWSTDSHGIYFYRGCGIEKYEGYGPSLVSEGNNTNFWIRNGKDRTKNYLILHTGNSSVSKSGETLTVNIGGTSYSLTNTNTWRGIQDNLTSTSTSDSLSANQGRILNNKFDNYLVKTTYDYHKEFSAGGTTYIELGCFSLYDSMVGIDITLTTTQSWMGRLIISSQNINSSGGGSYEVNVRGDNSLSLHTLISIVRSGTYFRVYLNASGWKKLFCHIWCVAASASEIFQTVNSMPSSNVTINNPSGTFGGNVYASNFYTTSDARKKQNIHKISDNIKQFEWKETGETSYGFVAQDLEVIHPELVNDNGNTKTVNYNAALSLVIAKLENRVKELETKLGIESSSYI